MSGDRRSRAQREARTAVVAWALGESILSARIWPVSDPTGGETTYSGRTILRPRRPDPTAEGIIDMAAFAFDADAGVLSEDPRASGWLAEAEELVRAHVADVDRVTEMLLDAEPKAVLGERMDAELGPRPAPRPPLV